MSLYSAGFVDVKMWLGVLKDEPESIEAPNIIPMESLDAFEINESMFDVLPSLYIALGDHGTWANIRLLRAGDPISVVITPRLRQDETEEPTDVKPLVKAEYTIQTVTKTLTDEMNYAIIKMFCVYNAQSYLNQIVTYPADTIENKILYTKKQSAEVMQEMLDGTSIGFTPEVKTDDSSYWLNCNETRAKFIERIVEHAWIKEGDAPISYVDRNGIMHLNSIENMINGRPPIFDCAFTKSVLEKTDDDQSKISTVIISDALHLNAAQPILNQGGYKLSYSLYNPYNKKELNKYDFPKYGTGGGAAAALADAAGQLTGAFGGSKLKDPEDGFRTSQYERKKPFLASLPNKRTNGIISDNIDGGMHFKELHMHYTIAPKHNETMRRSFFQNFVKFTVDTTRQGAFFGVKDYMFELGRTVNCRFDLSERPDALHSGKYVVCKLKYRYQLKQPFMIEAVVVNDGYYDLGA